MIRNFTLILLMLAPSWGMAQMDAILKDSIRGLFKEMRLAEDGDKMLIASKLEIVLSDYYSNPNHFQEELDSIPFLGQLSSSDGVVKMICWNLALSTGEFNYHCILRHRPTKETVAVTVLQDVKNWERIQRKSLRSISWYGALYYKILTNKFKGKTYYTLLGWDGKDAITNRKVVDALVVKGKTLSLGANIFVEEGKPSFRLIYEYANDATMSLNFDLKQKAIVMDHLAPEDSRYTGQYQFYGPDFSYDALTFEKGKWVLQKDVFATNKGLNNLSKEAKPRDFKD
ncbi:hypothetical protein ACFLR1_04300 [Bacteroidota bacterium]